jgi:hypothetical protein
MRVTSFLHCLCGASDQVGSVQELESELATLLAESINVFQRARDNIIALHGCMLPRASPALVLSELPMRRCWNWLKRAGAYRCAFKANGEPDWLHAPLFQQDGMFQHARMLLCEHLALQRSRDMTVDKVFIPLSCPCCLLPPVEGLPTPLLMTSSHIRPKFSRRTRMNNSNDPLQRSEERQPGVEAPSSFDDTKDGRLSATEFMLCNANLHDCDGSALGKHEDVFASKHYWRTIQPILEGRKSDSFDDILLAGWKIFPVEMGTICQSSKLLFAVQATMFVRFFQKGFNVRWVQPQQANSEVAPVVDALWQFVRSDGKEAAVARLPSALCMIALPFYDLMEMAQTVKCQQIVRECARDIDPTIKVNAVALSKQAIRFVFDADCAMQYKLQWSNADGGKSGPKQWVLFMLDAPFLYLVYLQHPDAPEADWKAMKPFRLIPMQDPPPKLLMDIPEDTLPFKWRHEILLEIFTSLAHIAVADVLKQCHQKRT